jgi:hypothetical protein
MGILNGIVEAADAVWRQELSNEAFTAGLNGRPPRVIFGSDRYREVYNESYRKGQEAAQARLMSTISRRLEDEG